MVEALQTNRGPYNLASAFHLAFGGEENVVGTFGNNGYFKGSIFGAQIYNTALDVSQINGFSGGAGCFVGAGAEFEHTRRLWAARSSMAISLC